MFIKFCTQVEDTHIHGFPQNLNINVKVTQTLHSCDIFKEKKNTKHNLARRIASFGI